MSMRRQQGYLMVDHRASPGLTEEQARACGYDPLFCKEGKLYEADTLTCAHCKTPVVKSPTRVRPRAECFQCGVKFICDACDYERTLPDYVHAPFEKIAEEIIRKELANVE